MKKRNPEEFHNFHLTIECMEFPTTYYLIQVLLPWKTTRTFFLTKPLFRKFLTIFSILIWKCREKILSEYKVSFIQYIYRRVCVKTVCKKQQTSFISSSGEIKYIKFNLIQSYIIVVSFFTYQNVWLVSWKFKVRISFAIPDAVG